MKHFLPSVLIRAWLAVLMMALGSCTIFRPYRLPTPKPSPEYLAQQKEAKARKKALAKPVLLFRKKVAPVTDEAATDVSTPSGAAVPAPVAAAAPPEARPLPEHSTVKYDKQLLMKKPKLLRRRVHKPYTPFRPGQLIRNYFKYGRHAKPDYSPDHRPAPKPDATDAPDAPDAPAPKAVPDAAPAAPPTGKP